MELPQKDIFNTEKVRAGRIPSQNLEWFKDMVIEHETLIIKSQCGPTKNLLGQTDHLLFIRVDWEKRILSAAIFVFRNVLMGMVRIYLGIRERFELCGEIGAAKVEV